MFTGLIEATAPVTAVERAGTGLRLSIASPGPHFTVERGSSVAVSGACLTVVAGGPPSAVGVEAGETGGRGSGSDLVFDVSNESLVRTWFRAMVPGRVVNLERALRLGDRLDGHLVAGHVDGRGKIMAIESGGDGGRLITFEVEAGLERYLIDKGSVTLDGISLTVVSPRDRRFAVAVIPLTLEKTSLGRARVGDEVNVESDMIGKWLDRLRT